MTYPTDIAERRALREERQRAIIADARARAAVTGSSINCRHGNHRRREDPYGWVGCANDGTGCLCECHDPAEARQTGGADRD